MGKEKEALNPLITSEKKNENSSLHSEKKKIRKKKKMLTFLLLFSLSTVILFYFGGVYYFQNRLLPCTKIDGINYGYRIPHTVGREIEDQFYDTFHLKLTDGEENIVTELNAQDMGIFISVVSRMEEVSRNQNAFFWLTSLFYSQCHDYNFSYGVEYDSDKIRNTLEEKGIFSEFMEKAPEDAYIGEYQADKKAYELIPETLGMQLEKDVTLKKVYEAIEQQESILDLRQSGCYKTAKITAQDRELQKRLDTLNKMVGTRIVYDWNGTEEVLDGDTISAWIDREDGQPVLNEEKVAEYIKEKARKYDTYGKKRKFITTKGMELTLPSGAYGWQTDRKNEKEALMAFILEGAVIEREPEYIERGYVKGSEDIGDSYVEIDLTEQYLYLYIDKDLVLETNFVSGDMAKGNVTPPGVFGITYKTRNAVLRGEDYETPVSYWMPFNGNIGMHDASWRRKFGGNIYLTNGSHGCINLPPKKAEEIYKYMEKRFPVICYY